MRLALAATGLATLLATAASAGTVGVTMQSFDDNFQTLLRNGLTQHATDLGVDMQVEDSQRDVGRQLSQVNNFIASGVEAIVVTLADTAAAPAITAAAEAAHIPLVYLNLQPENVAALPDDEAYVGSKETEAGFLGATEACRELKAAGKTEAHAYIMMGDLAHTAALQRTQAVKDVLATPECSFITVNDAQSAGWLRTTALDLMTNWLTAGDAFDVVFANNDEMAIGATQAMKAAGIDMKSVVVVGVDATQDGLAAMRAGDLDITVFQNARAQAAGALDAALALAKGDPVDSVVTIPFELVTPDKLDSYTAQN
ncbi:MAG: substrate-binding domain-containing protein [Amaricoccus sp.]|uniref:substrate-binding domain-containing protein n=1 Tax=Amaricoccus sp. TaxID=1872485 RepID=UPI0039E2BE0C